MAEHSLIEWTDATWQPITGCSVVSPGCTNCYAMKLAGTRLKHHPSRKGLTRDSKAGPVWTGEVRLNEQWLDQPLRWKRPRKIFVCAHGDLFAENVPDAWIDRVFAVMALAPQHTFQVLTKRASRMERYVSAPATQGRIYDLVLSEEVQVVLIADPALEAYAPPGPRVHLGTWPLPNVWLGVSAEDQTRADERIPDLLATPAAVRFVSAEPLIGPINLERIGNLDRIAAAFPEVVERCRRDAAPNKVSGLQIEAVGKAGQATIFHQTPDHMGGFSIRFPRPFPRIDWVIVGGESGPGARPMHPAWVRSLRDQCAAAGTAFFFKQWGEWTAFYDRDVQDPDWRHVPGVDNQMGRGAERWLNLAGGCGFHGERLVAVRNVGKKSAGRLLDLQDHSSFPEVVQ